MLLKSEGITLLNNILKQPCICLVNSQLESLHIVALIPSSLCLLILSHCSFRDLGTQVLFCSAFFFLQLMLTGTALPLQAARHKGHTVSVHKLPPFLSTFSHSSPPSCHWQATRCWALALHSSLWENYLIWAQGQEQPAVLHAHWMRWPLFLEEYYMAYGGVRVSV